jgi:hypothetical protein
VKHLGGLGHYQQLEPPLNTGPAGSKDLMICSLEQGYAGMHSKESGELAMAMEIGAVGKLVITTEPSYAF